MQKSNNNHGKHDSKYDMINALGDICNKYPRLSYNDVVRFAPIYYPIATIEMDMDEVSFEDFEIVQHTVLKLVALGIEDADSIADLLGLNANYITGVLKLLIGYGHIENGKISSLGMESVQQEKKITKSRVKQKFQMDALNGTLLKINQLVTGSALNERSDTKMRIAHMDYLDGISVQSIKNQFQGNSQHFLYQKSTILNTNVTNINDVTCIDVKYADGYLVQFNGIKEPLIFAKRYDQSQKDRKQRFSMKPFGIPSKMFAAKYALEEDIPVNTEEANNFNKRLYELILKRGAQLNALEEAEKAINKLYRFNQGGITIHGVDSRDVIVASVTATAFSGYNQWIVRFLFIIAEKGEYLISNEYLYGRVISLRLANDRLKAIVEDCKIIVAKLGADVARNKVKQKLDADEKLDKCTGSALIDALATVIKGISVAR